MRIWAIWAVQTTFPKDEVWFSLLQLLVVIALLATLAILAVPHVLALRQKSRVATLTAIAEPILQALARSAARINGHYPLTAAIDSTDGNAGWQSRMKSWAIWIVQTVFPKDEAWFGLPQLLMVTALLSTLAMLAVPHVLSLRQKGYAVIITAEASPMQYPGHDLCLPGRDDLHAASDRRYA
jgi:Tfp pilus assembly protein FimT